VIYRGSSENVAGACKPAKRSAAYRAVRSTPLSAAVTIAAAAAAAVDGNDDDDDDDDVVKTAARNSSAPVKHDMERLVRCGRPMC